MTVHDSSRHFSTFVHSNEYGDVVACKSACWQPHGATWQLELRPKYVCGRMKRDYVVVPFSLQFIAYSL